MDLAWIPQLFFDLVGRVIPSQLHRENHLNRIKAPSSACWQRAMRMVEFFATGTCVDWPDTASVRGDLEVSETPGGFRESVACTIRILSRVGRKGDVEIEMIPLSYETSVFLPVGFAERLRCLYLRIYIARSLLRDLVAGSQGESFKSFLQP